MSLKHADQDWQGKLARARWFTFAVMLFDRIWTLILPVFLIVLVFLSASWFNLFKIVSVPLQIVLLVGFAVLLFWYLIPFLKLKIPNQMEVDRRIEKDSGLSYQPIFAQYDELPPNSSDTAKILWQAHRARLRKSLSNVQSSYPNLDITKHDSYGISALVVLSFAVAFAYSFSPASGRVGDAFYFGKHTDWSNMRLDAWVTPPDYTGRAPIYLVENNANVNADKGFDVPVNSIVNVRVSSRDTRLKLTAEWQDQGNKVKNSTLRAKQDDQGDFVTYDVRLNHSMKLKLKGPQTDLAWQFNVMPDKAPQISWIEDPKRALNGLLELSYKIDDDYGATKAWASFDIVDYNQAPDNLTSEYEDETSRHSLFPVPEIDLVLPRNGQGIAQTLKDFSKNPWAGSRVYLTLHVENAAGHSALSERKELILPQRIFGNSLARALIEQRNLLIFDTVNKHRVLDMLYAIQIRPQDTIKNVTTTIALASVKQRLAVAQTDDAFRNVANYLWDIADGVEGNGLSAAAQRLQVAQQALRDALRNGATQEEIERLMADLKNAMTAYIDELAQNGQQVQEKSGLQIQDLSSDALQKKLKELEDFAKLGNRAGAEQLLSELKNILDNMQVVQSEGNSGRGSGESQKKDKLKEEIQKNIDNLSNLLRQQQELLNDTNKITDEYQRDEKTDQDFSNDFSVLKNRQQELQNNLKDLQDSLEKQGMKPIEGFKDAARAMEEAQDALNNLDGRTAIKNQADALNAMRNGGQDMMNQMREALKKQGQGIVGDSQKKDPLGRIIGNEHSNNSDSIMPSENDIDRARHILDEIRKRLGYLTPEIQRQYLERLLNFN